MNIVVNWTDKGVLFSTLDMFVKQNTVLIQGGCRGADRLVADYCRNKNIKCITVPALWSEYGKAAGPIRNKEMLDTYRPDIVLAFHDNLELSKGTKNMVD